MSSYIFFLTSRNIKPQDCIFLSYKHKQSVGNIFQGLGMMTTLTLPVYNKTVGPVSTLYSSTAFFYIHRELTEQRNQVRISKPDSHIFYCFIRRQRSSVQWNDSFHVCLSVRYLHILNKVQGLVKIFLPSLCLEGSHLVLWF